MRSRSLRLINLLLREAISPATLKRTPEPSAVMDESDSVDSFHAQGTSAGALRPLYHLNALACSQRLQKHATLLDLGSGSGQFLIHLARCRPDIKIIGLDLSEAMVRVGRQIIKDSGLEKAIDLRVGDMTDFSQHIPEQVDLVSSVFALHHLPDVKDIVRCLSEISQIRERCGCGIWIFDHSRPRHAKTASTFPEIFTPDAAPRFKIDSRNSLIASWRFDELSAYLEQAKVGKLEHRLSRLVRLYQAHWTEPLQKEFSVNVAWNGAALSAKHRREYKTLRGLFKDLS